MKDARPSRNKKVAGTARSRAARITPTVERAPDSPPGGRSSSRREQQRSVETRLAILKAALATFAEYGFEGTSTREIGERAGLHYTLITYHFRTKDALWRATAEHFFTEMVDMWEREAPEIDPSQPIELLRSEFRNLLHFSVSNPDFHRFMTNESRSDNDRLTWLMDTFLAPIMRRTIPQIETAQAAGDLPLINPVLIHYFLVGATTIISSLGGEIRQQLADAPDDVELAMQYWDLVEQIIFRPHLYKGGGRD
jgi:AcrR family transcriptional regulator